MANQTKLRFQQKSANSGPKMIKNDTNFTHVQGGPGGSNMAIFLIKLVRENGPFQPSGPHLPSVSTQIPLFPTPVLFLCLSSCMQSEIEKVRERGGTKTGQLQGNLIENAAKTRGFRDGRCQGRGGKPEQTSVSRCAHMQRSMPATDTGSEGRGRTLSYLSATVTSLVRNPHR